MSDSVSPPSLPDLDSLDTCAQCSTTLTPDTRVAAGDRVFCPACYESLRAELERAVAAMSTDVNYAGGALGAVLGAGVGVLVWWGFTVLTHVALGLIAVAIGFLSGHGAVRFSGGKRSAGLQALSIGVAVLAFFIASYLVNMTFINRQLAAQAEAFRVAFPPQSLTLFIRVVSTDFGIMDAVFLAIVVYEAWKIPRPITLLPGTAA